MSHYKFDKILIKNKTLNKSKRYKMENKNNQGLQSLLHWMEVNESGPYTAIRAALLSQMKSSVCKNLMFHFQYAEKAKSASQVIFSLMQSNFSELLSYGDDELIIFSEGNPLCVVDISSYSTYLSISMTGIEPIVNQVVDLIEATGRTKKQPIVSRIFKNNYGFDTTELTLPVLNTVENVSAFYPFIDATPDEMWNEFKNSSANVLLFIGPPGTGKTSYIRQMLDCRGYEEEVHLVDNESLLLDPELMGYVQSDADMNLLITEDADRFVAKREDDNVSMVGLLNASSGLAGGRVKFIISTNLPNLNDVDEALIRPGRCHKVVQFCKLKPEQAIAARKAAGLPNEHLGFSKDVTLAEALNTENGAKKLVMGMGFISK